MNDKVIAAIKQFVTDITTGKNKKPGKIAKLIINELYVHRNENGEYELPNFGHETDVRSGISGMVTAYMTGFKLSDRKAVEKITLMGIPIPKKEE